MKIEVSDEVGLQLEQLAKESSQSIDELISAMLDEIDVVRNCIGLAQVTDNHAEVDASESETVGACPPYLAKLANERGVSPEYLSKLLEKEYPPGSMGRLAQVAVKTGMASKERVDTAAQSREILNTEYADYLKKRRTSCQ
ncbi:MAG: hypothetical protein OXG49_07535 [Chloroflexi bacterium]|nr:hypothetical protein [Chloroflexota bacterium]